MIYQASSPDEAALVSGAELLGYQFHVSFICPGSGPKLTTLDAQTQIYLRPRQRPRSRVRDS